MIETVVVGIKESESNERLEEILARTMEIAKPSQATVVLCHVFSDEEYSGKTTNYGDAASKLGYKAEGRDATADDVAKRLTIIKEAKKTLEENGIEVKVRGAIGNRAEELVRVAENEDASRLFVGGRKRSPAGKAMFGSASQEVLLNSPCPVTYVCGKSDKSKTITNAL